VDTEADLRSLPRPTDEQYRQFAEHIANAHSWYKHLPLLTGGQFVVFLSPDAGIGRLVARIEGGSYRLVTPAEGPVFTEDNPRLHYSWKTSEEYRRRFGHLDYAYRSHPEYQYGRDVGGPMHLPAEIWERCTFTLFPYVAGGDSGRNSVRWTHDKAVASLKAGESHPQREAVMEWIRLVEEHDAAWSALTKEEQDLLLDRFSEKNEKPRSTTPGIDHYLAIEAHLETVYHDRLRRGELQKIQRALEALRTWLD
jgi:hypothetical protein